MSAIISKTYLASARVFFANSVRLSSASLTLTDLARFAGFGRSSTAVASFSASFVSAAVAAFVDAENGQYCDILVIPVLIEANTELV